MNDMAAETKLTAKDYASDQEIRWCPGCGDYAILKAVQRTLAHLNADADKTVFVSGIGCAARFPYYMSTYGFHTIHGRAAAVATGLKIVNPELDIWLASGDGDSLSIGGNHLLHVLRRNVDLQYLLFNNEIYGLTKGQYSPTSRLGTSSPSSPDGSTDAPVHPIKFALGAGAKFVARAIDVNQPHLVEVLKRAKSFRGTSFVEILQNCIVYNDGVFHSISDKKVAADKQLMVEHGEPMLFGKEKEKGIRLNTSTLSLEVVAVGEGGASVEDVLVHDEGNPIIAQLLGTMEGDDYPVAIGVLYVEASAPHHVAFGDAKPLPKGFDDLHALFDKGPTWTVE